MKFKPFIVAMLMAIALSLTIVAPFVFADGNLSSNQSNQSLNQPSVLVAPEPSFEINVYPQPGTKKQRVGYGLGGDRVTVLEQVSSNEGYIWKYVQFAGSSKLKGWIREEFVASDVQKNTQENIQRKYQSQNGNSQRSSFQQDQGYVGDRQRQYQESQRKTHYSQQQN
jgi:hypothetical protein